MRGYHQDTNNSGSIQSLPNLMLSSNSSNNNNGQNQIHYDQIMQENLTLKYEITNLQKSLAEAQIYSKTAYDTFQALREKFGKK
jgi:regulator of replication initiation timing